MSSLCLHELFQQVEDVEAHAVNAVNAVNAKRQRAKEDPETGDIQFESEDDDQDKPQQPPVDGQRMVKDVDSLASAGIQRQARTSVKRGTADEEQGGLTYLPPSEVQAIAKRLWEVNYQVLRYLFCAGT